MTLLVAFLTGVVFAVGLAVAGMTAPEKIVAFLDVTGDWDPSLAFVMVSAIGVYLPVHLVVRRRARPLAGSRFAIPEESPIDARLVGGAAIFGAGWGLSGYCPGPAVVSLASAGQGVTLFVAGMLAALVAYELTRKVYARSSAQAG
jgi:uncharacterized membrane protein YedE/YeeE